MSQDIVVDAGDCIGLIILHREHADVRVIDEDIRAKLPRVLRDLADDIEAEVNP